MSETHFGGYCAKRDKMMLGQNEAVEIARRMVGTGTYLCEHCGAYHLHSGRGRLRIKRKKKASTRFRICIDPNRILKMGIRITID
jgi:hypothetical protein